MMSKKQDMNAESRTVFIRSYLAKGLPEGCAPSDPHLQIFDNYIQDSDLRLRKVRNPSDNKRYFSLQKVRGTYLTAQIELSEAEYEAIGYLRGRETRLNRYQLDEDGVDSTYDIFLGNLWGLMIRKIAFKSDEDRDSFKPPVSALSEITSDPFFFGQNLVDIDFESIQSHLSQRKRGARGTS